MHSTVSSLTSKVTGYDPFARGRFPVGVRTIEALDTARDRLFPCEIWHPESAEGRHPLILYSHHSGGGRRAASYLCDHLASHGYVVAALDHSEVIAEQLKGKDGETAEQLRARVDAWIANRVPDIRFLLDHMLGSAETHVDPIASESWDTASEGGQRWPHPRLNRVSGRWWHSRPLEVPSQSRGSFRRI